MSGRCRPRPRFDRTAPTAGCRCSINRTRWSLTPRASRAVRSGGRPASANDRNARRNSRLPPVSKLQSVTAATDQKSSAVPRRASQQSRMTSNIGSLRADCDYLRGRAARGNEKGAQPEMSHIVSIKTRVRDPAALAAACARLGLDPPVQGAVKLFSGQAEGLVVKLPGWHYPAVIDVATGEVKYDNYGGAWGSQAELDK